MSDTQTSRGVIAPGRAESFTDLLALQPHSIASRVVARSTGGNVTLFAIDAGEGLSEHSAPFDALAVVVEGDMLITVGGQPVTARAGRMVLMPANVPHALEAQAPSRMLLVMLK
jgi:quercetin dioxygenase-like cupin family protein